MLEKKNLNKKFLSVLTGVILVLLGITLVSFDYLKQKKNRAFEIINFELYELDEKNDAGDYENDDLEEIDEEPKIPEENDKPIEKPSEQPIEKPSVSYNYIGMLEIPKIGLKKGFVDPNNKANNVDQNITIIKTSLFPDVDKGNFILAAHSGTGYISYFKNLYKLSVGDYTYIYYKNVKYTYKIVNIYTQPKIGTISIYRDHNETVLTLITCTKNDETKQTVYIANLVEKSNY